MLSLITINLNPERFGPDPSRSENSENIIGSEFESATKPRPTLTSLRNCAQVSPVRYVLSTA